MPDEINDQILPLNNGENDTCVVVVDICSLAAGFDRKIETMEDSVSNLYCTTRQAAKLLGVSVRSVQLWVEKGALEAWKTDGGHRRVSRQSVQLLREGRLNALGEPAPQSLAATVAQSGKTYAAPEERLKILVVEDDKLLLRLYRLRMEAWQLPLDIITAPNAIEGLLLIGRESPDLLISDLSMPELDGMTMVRTICQSPFREGLEIVIVTGLSAEDVQSRPGMPEDVRVFQKPVPFSELRLICENLLAQRRLLEAATTSSIDSVLP